MKSIVIALAAFLTFAACQSNQSSKPMKNPGSSGHEVIVKEVIQVGSYTYLRVTENNSELWLATPPTNASIGQTMYYTGGFEMVNFKSKELNRTFDNILFLEGISSEPVKEQSSNSMISPGAQVVKEGKKDIKIVPAEGAITIAELYSNKESYKGKVVKVKAQVTKFSPEIMGTNWIHLQDGSESDGNFDLAITSNNTVNVGDIVVFEGTITLDKDLGYGYFFEIIMENAKIIQ
jgi:hypothetical protein